MTKYSPHHRADCCSWRYCRPDSWSTESTPLQKETENIYKYSDFTRSRLCDYKMFKFWSFLSICSVHVSVRRETESPHWLEGLSPLTTSSPLVSRDQDQSLTYTSDHLLKKLPKSMTEHGTDLEKLSCVILLISAPRLSPQRPPIICRPYSTYSLSHLFGPKLTQFNINFSLWSTFHILTQI